MPQCSSTALLFLHGSKVPQGARGEMLAGWFYLCTPFFLALVAFVAQVPHQKCWDEPREHCTQKTVSCTDLIFKISCSGARGKEGLCANQEGSKLPQEVVKSTEHLVCHCKNFTSWQSCAHLIIDAEKNIAHYGRFIFIASYREATSLATRHDC